MRARAHRGSSPGFINKHQRRKTMLRKRRKVPRRRTFSLAALEDRSLLSGNVTATLLTTGQLTIAGDTANNKITIMTDPFGPTKNIRIVGDPGTGTTVNNADFVTFDM